jgi:hypothetical protein
MSPRTAGPRATTQGLPEPTGAVGREQQMRAAAVRELQLGQEENDHHGVGLRTEQRMLALRHSGDV